MKGSAIFRFGLVSCEMDFRPPARRLKECIRASSRYPASPECQLLTHLLPIESKTENYDLTFFQQSYAASGGVMHHPQGLELGRGA